MRLFRLDPRLEAVAGAIPEGARLWDVGSDHARLPVYLACTGRISHAVASDIAEGPLAAAARTVRRFGCEDTVELIKCDGVPPDAAERADCFVIAGMGGFAITRILDAAPALRDALVIMQPMTSRDELRSYLREGGFSSYREIAAADGRRRYEILICDGRKG